MSGMDLRNADRLANARNLWVATVRPDGRPHLTPVWFVTAAERLYICISKNSVKAANLYHNPRIACSLENGDSPIICEGEASPAPAPWPDTVLKAYKEKYDWDLDPDGDYGLLVEIRPAKWLKWNE